MTRKQAIVETLAGNGIRTIGDLDDWRMRQQCRDTHGPFIPSRYKALVWLVGESAAIIIMNELAILQCTRISIGEEGAR